MKRFIGVTFAAAAILLCLSLNSFAGDMVSLKWKFPSGAKYTYDFSQSMTMSTGMKTAAKTPDIGETKMSAGGPITVTCNGEGATVKIDLSATEAEVAGHEMTQDQMDMMSQSTEIPMDADGRIKQGRYSAGGNMQLFMDTLFPIPPKGLNVLEPVTQDMVMFSSGGISNLKGKATYTLKGIKVIDGITCADYHVSCKLKSVPDKEKTKGIAATASLAGEYDCLFAIDNGIFISVEGTEIINMNAAFNMKGDALAKPDKLSMVQNHKTSLNLKSAEYNQTPDAQQDTPEGTQDSQDTQDSQEDTQ